MAKGQLSSEDILAGQVDDVYGAANVDRRRVQLKLRKSLVQVFRDAPVHNSVGRCVIGRVPDYNQLAVDTVYGKAYILSFDEIPKSCRHVTISFA